MKEKVSFNNANIKMAGELYLPAGFDKSKKYTAIVCVHPGGGVKEQTVSIYAGKLAELGYVALTFDASHQGESEGVPRYLEDPSKRVEDVRCAVDYLVTLPFVDAERIGALGVCAGGGYAVNAAQTESRIKAVAGVSSADIGGLFREGFGKTATSESKQATLKAVADQRTAEAKGAEPMYVPWAPCSPEEINENTPVLFSEAYDYYRTPRAQHPNSPNKMLFVSIDRLMAFSAFGLINELLHKPLLLIAGSKADTLYYSLDAYALANEPKELFIVEGATHIDMYDIPQYVSLAVEKLKEFYGKNL